MADVREQGWRRDTRFACPTTKADEKGLYKNLSRIFLLAVFKAN